MKNLMTKRNIFPLYTIRNLDNKSPLQSSPTKISKFPRSANKLAIAREQTTRTVSKKKKILERKDSGHINNTGREELESSSRSVTLNKLEAGNVGACPRHGTTFLETTTTTKNFNGSATRNARIESGVQTSAEQTLRDPEKIPFNLQLR